MGKDYSTMTVSELEDLRALVLERIGAVPAFRRGSLQVGYRKCGKPTCRCARPGERGHGPRALWTRTAKDGSRGQYVPVEHADQVRAELDAHDQFLSLVEDYVEVNEALCKAAVPAPAARTRTSPGPGGEKGGPSTRA
ncbi:MAG: hypothetical protein FWF21_12905 [Micrococcales bacterium]|nr:hypothetical protein [Micrococcales bacterium]